MNIRIPTSLLSVVILSLSAAFPAHAGAPTNTWVSGLGSDSNPGTIAQPFATLQKAVSVTAAGGLISVADPGDFGAVIITGSITIDGGSQGATIQYTQPSGEAIAVVAGPTDVVVLRNLSLNGGSTPSSPAGFEGINMGSGGRLIVENCTLNGFAYGIVDSTSVGADLVVRNTSIDGCQYGLLVNDSSGTAYVSLSAVNISGASSYGIYCETGAARVEISDSVITQDNFGIFLSASGQYLTADTCVFSFNTTAAYASAGATIRLANNEILDNGTGIGSGTGAVLSLGNNAKGGNGAPGAPTAAMSEF